MKVRKKLGTEADRDLWVNFLGFAFCGLSGRTRQRVGVRKLRQLTLAYENVPPSTIPPYGQLRRLL